LWKLKIVIGYKGSHDDAGASALLSLVSPWQRQNMVRIKLFDTKFREQLAIEMGKRLLVRWLYYAHFVLFLG
jgi:hypothetical protein